MTSVTGLFNQAIDFLTVLRISCRISRNAVDETLQPAMSGIETQEPHDMMPLHRIIRITITLMRRASWSGASE
jgi:hypothetical protein